MKTILFLCVLVFSFSSCSISSTKEWNDDRLVESPKDSLLKELIIKCKTYSDLNRNPEFDSTVYYVTFDFYVDNDTDKICTMGGYGSPIVFHDSTGFGQNNFVGYFKYEQTYCFIYQNSFDTHSSGISDNIKKFVLTFLEDWRLRTPSDNPEFFIKDLSGWNIDPYMFEYSIDSIGNVQLLRKGHW